MSRGCANSSAERTMHAAIDASRERGEAMDLTTLERLPLWIGGRAYAPSTTRYGEVTNPATGEVIRHVPYANAADVDAAVRAAADAFPAWSTAPALRRARI